MYKTSLVMGLPRAGTTLTCKILNGFKDSVALMEPIRVDTLKPEKGSLQACKDISLFSFEARKKITYESLAPTQHAKGNIPDNPISCDFKEDKLREAIVSYGAIEIDKKLNRGFSLSIKHNALFASLLKDLINFFPCYAIIRNPLSLLASWATVNLPIHSGRIPAGERFDLELKAKLDSEKDTIKRQLIILNWFFTQFDTYLPKSNIIRYEDIIKSSGEILEVITKSKIEDKLELKSKNANSIYKRVDIDYLYNQLLNSKGLHWKYYSKSEIDEVYHLMRGK